MKIGARYEIINPNDTSEINNLKKSIEARIKRRLRIVGEERHGTITFKGPSYDKDGAYYFIDGYWTR